jgi:hypothetical protein
LLVAETESCAQATIAEALAHFESLLEQCNRAVLQLDCHASRQTDDAAIDDLRTIVQHLVEIIELEPPIVVHRSHNRLILLHDRLFGYATSWCRIATRLCDTRSTTAVATAASSPSLSADEQPQSNQQSAAATPLDVGGPASRISTVVSHPTDAAPHRSAVVDNAVARVLCDELFDLALKTTAWLQKDRLRLSTTGCKKVPLVLSKIERYQLAVRKLLAHIGANDLLASSMHRAIPIHVASTNHCTHPNLLTRSLAD